MNDGYGVFGHVPDDASHGGGDSITKMTMRLGAMG